MSQGSQTPLQLEYPDKYRLWSELIQGSADRVFITTGELAGVGTRLPVRLGLPGVPLHIVIEGTVIGRRTGSLRFPAGLYLRFASPQIEKCRRFLGLSQTPNRYEQGRKAPRHRCELPLAFGDPHSDAGGMARNISESGLLVMAPLELTVGQRVQAELDLGEPSPLLFEADVSWARNDKRLAGLRFVDLSAEAAGRIARMMASLGAPDAAHARGPILVADDEPNILEFLTKALSKHGYAVQKARRGEEALDLIREVKPRLVLLDILMPGLDGVDICKMMRSDVEMLEIPVIFVSALDSQRLHQVADEAGATDYLAKPVNLADLMNLVGVYLRQEPGAAPQARPAQL